MVPNEQGRHCSACSKTVIDFTNYSDQEIADYFIALNGQGVCGHFKKQQVDRIRIELPETILTTRLARWKKFLVVCMLVFGTSLFPFETVLSQTLIASTTTESIKKQQKKKAVKRPRLKRPKMILTESVFICDSNFTLDGFSVIEKVPSSELRIIYSTSGPLFSVITDREKPIIEGESLPDKDKTPTPPSKKESQFYILPEKIRTRRSHRKKP